MPIVPLADIPLKGEHNIENVLAAVCAACVVNIPAEVIARTVASFQAVEHRLEFVAAIHGVDYYNDSKATNVDATAKAIASFPGNIHLILGGKDKNSDYTQLNALLRARVKAVYTIGSAAEKIEGQIAGVTSVIHAGHARGRSRPGGQPGSCGRRGPSGAGLLQLRPVRKLRRAGKSLQAERMARHGAQ